MKTIGIDQSSFTRSYIEHKCMNNIKKIYQHAGKCYAQQNLNYTLDASMELNTGGFKYDSPNVPMTSTPAKTKVLVNHCVYSPIYLMLKRKQQNIALELQNPNAEP